MLKTVGNPSARVGDQTINSGSLVIATNGEGIQSAGGVFTQAYVLIGDGATYDLAIDPSLRGFAGILSVSATRGNFNPQSTRTVFAIAAYGTTMTTTSLHTQDGASGACGFSITCPSPGVVRFTDTSGHGSAIELFMAFNGALNFNY